MENKPRMMTKRDCQYRTTVRTRSSPYVKRRKAPGYLYREKGTN